VIYANRNRMELVRPDYYAEEMRYQGQIDRLQRTKMLGSELHVTFDPKSLQLRIQMPPNHRNQIKDGSLSLYRPSSAAADLRFPWSIDSDGVLTVDLHSCAAGLWRLRLSWSFSNQEYFHEEELIIPTSRPMERQVATVP